MSDRYAVVLSRAEYDFDGLTEDKVIVGTFRTLGRAQKRAGVIRRLAETYDEPEAELSVNVEPVRASVTSAQDALDFLYGAIS